MLILPIERWRSGNQLVDPTGVPFDPNSPPAIIAGDYVLNSAIAFGRENPRRIGVTVLCGLQTEAVDLGKPGDFEALMGQADLYGSSRFCMPVRPGTEGYARRVEAAMINNGRPTLLPYNTMEWDDPSSTTLENLQNIGMVVGDSVKSYEMMQGLDMGSLGMESVPEEVALNAFTGKTHVANHLNWLAVATACDQVRRMDRDEEVHVLIDEGITGSDIARKFGALGVRTELHGMGRDTWPPNIRTQVANFRSTMSTGHFKRPIQ